MFQHLLVPLDGSKLAEASLPYAVTLCQVLNAAVTLIHIIEHNAPQEIHGERHLREEKEAEEYLKQVARQFFPPPLGIRVSTHVHTEEVRNVARSISAHAGEMAPDLIVMCTHGESGAFNLMGSIAQQIIGHGKTPILLVQPGEKLLSAPVTLQKFLVALDGDAEHEQGLKTAEELAKYTHASLHLLTVIPTLGTLSGERAAAGRLLPGATSAMLDMTEECTIDYLEEKAAAVRAQGIGSKTTIRRGDPVQQILADSQDEDLIVLGTHGKAGINAFWAGSVAPKIVSQTRLPVLLVPATAH
jgi:nucleotide-binding universal stress UspA family protein